MNKKTMKPIITEKSMIGAGTGKYAFFVDASQNKAQIAENVEEAHKVEVTKVNIIKSKPITAITKGRFKSVTKSYKKAIVTLKKGQKIEGYEVKE